MNPLLVARESVTVSVLLLAAGCATTTAPAPSGFLDDYTSLVETPEDPSLLWWERTGFDWTDYHALMIDPVEIYFDPVGQDRAVSAAELAQLKSEFHAAVMEVLGDDYPLVTKPGAGVLRIRCAITDVVPVRPGVNVAASLVAFVPLETGGASIEVEFIDSVTGERLAAGVDQKIGSRLDGFTSFSKLGYAREAFHTWATELRAALDTNP